MILFLFFISLENFNFQSINSDLKDNELIINVAKNFLGTKYLANTLDTGFTENCVVNLENLDCVTFVENVVCLSYLIKNQKEINEKNLIDVLKVIRYKDGWINDYTSRNHYSSAWILENTKNGLFTDLTKELGGEKVNFNLNFMSKNPQFYKQLKNNSELIEKINKIENEINQKDFYYIPKNKVKKIENKLESGDLVFIKTNVKGLDYSHLGFIDKRDGNARLLHASSNEKKVILDTTISEYIRNKKTQEGITILRWNSSNSEK